MPPETRVHYGRRVEDAALAWLQAQTPGLRVLARNYRIRGGELDLVVEEAGTLVFIEIRARNAPGWVSGIESIGWKKRQCLRRVIGHYLARYEGRARMLRVDALTWDGKRWQRWRDLQLEESI